MPEADKADIIMYQSTRRKPVNWLVGDGSVLSKVVALLVLSEILERNLPKLQLLHSVRFDTYS